MKDNDFENKMMQGIRDSLRAAKENLTPAIKSIDDMLKKELGEEGYARYIAFQKKYLKLVQQGRTREAKELEEIYKNGE